MHPTQLEGAREPMEFGGIITQQGVHPGDVLFGVVGGHCGCTQNGGALLHIQVRQSLLQALDKVRFFPVLFTAPLRQDRLRGF